MPSTTTTENHSLTYPAEGATGWYSTWEALMQQITDYLDDITDMRVTTIKDTNGNEQLVLSATGSAVNHLQITNAATGNAPIFQSTGDDSNVDMLIRHKGTSGKIILQDSSGNEIIETAQIASAVNHMKFTNAATGNSPLLEATGSDSDVDFRVRHKGSGGRIVLEDANGNELLETAQTSSAVNHVKVTNAATGNAPILEAEGSDSNVNLRLAHKGSSGKIILEDASGNELLETAQTSSAVNHVKVTNAATGNDPDIAAVGGDSNVGISVTAKGTGNVDLSAGTNVTVNKEIVDSTNSIGLGWFPLSKTTISNDTNIDIELTSGYDVYMLRFDSIVVATDNRDLLMRLSNDGGSTFENGASDYGYAAIYNDWTASVSGQDSSGDSEIQLAINQGSASGGDLFGELTIYNAAASGTPTMIKGEFTYMDASAPARLAQQYTTGRRLASETTTDIRIFYESGAVATSGTITLYGRNI